MKFLLLAFCPEVNWWTLMLRIGNDYLYNFNAYILEDFEHIISLASDVMENDISHASVRAKVSAASVDRATRFNLVEFQAIGVMLSNLSHKKTMKPP